MKHKQLIGKCARRAIGLALLVGMAFATAEAQNRNDSLPQEDAALFLPESWELKADSLAQALHRARYDAKYEGMEGAAPVSDSIYILRLEAMNNVINLPFNSVVRSCIELYTERRRGLMEYVLGLEHVYFPMMEQALDAAGLPDELKYLSVVESALNPTAFSRVGASGLWQFMLQTGKQYGLEINSLVDERRDPQRSTEAAVAYLKALYDVYGDWALALAAYNCGPGNVNKAIRRAEGQRDYWKIYPYLPRETRMYVPYFIAVNYAMNFYAFHGLHPDELTLYSGATDTVMVDRALHFDQLSDILGISREELRALNPQYKRDIVPGNSRPRVLRLPPLLACAFAEKEEQIYAHRREELLPTTPPPATAGPQRITHVVKKGDTFRSLENRYGVSAAQIRKWNRMASRARHLPVGRKLVIYIDNGGFSLN